MGFLGGVSEPQCIDPEDGHDLGLVATGEDRAGIRRVVDAVSVCVPTSSEPAKDA